MYGAETWAVKKAQKNKLDVAEMRMLRWMSGVTKLDRIRNERIRGTTKVGEISKKVQESRLKWYGHVLRREYEYVGKRVMAMEVPGNRRRGIPNVNISTSTISTRGHRFKLQTSQFKRDVANNQFCNRVVSNWINQPESIVATASIVHFKKALRTAHFEAALNFKRHY